MVRKPIRIVYCKIMRRSRSGGNRLRPSATNIRIERAIISSRKLKSGLCPDVSRAPQEQISHLTKQSNRITAQTTVVMMFIINLARPIWGARRMRRR